MDIFQLAQPPPVCLVKLCHARQLLALCYACSSTPVTNPDLMYYIATLVPRGVPLRVLSVISTRDSTHGGLRDV